MLQPEPLNPIPSHYEPKTVWRAWAKAQRSFVCSSATNQQNAEQLMLQQLHQFIEMQPTIGTVGLYIPLAFEPCLLALLSYFPNKQWAFPRIGQAVLKEATAHLFFHTVPASVMKNAHCEKFIAQNFNQNTWGLWEPPASWQQPPQLDLLIIPALAMDREGVRLGYGGGFFDRWLGVQVPKPSTVGVCWEACIVEALPKEVFDVTLSAICTEKNILLAK